LRLPHHINGGSILGSVALAVQPYREIGIAEAAAFLGAVAAAAPAQLSVPK